MKRTVLFIPKSELLKHFHKNVRQDLKVVTPAIITEKLAAKLCRRGKDAKKEIPLEGISWTHSSPDEPNRICESRDFGDKFISPVVAGPVAISFANSGSVEHSHYHKEHWEVYFSEHKIVVEYRLPGKSHFTTETLPEGGAIVFAPGVVHRMGIHGLTIVLEVPALAGDREVEEEPIS